MPERVALLLRLSWVMATTISTGDLNGRTNCSAAILRWTFLRGTQALTCEVRVTGKQSYDVSVVPHWDVSSSVIEVYDRPSSALRRHAELSWYFREAGWTLAREGQQLEFDAA